ncbi:MAG TPA: bile acid:sodium symporter family protein [Sphingomonas sp.]|jgi:sodium/bile acid cotransporter 7|nr:bile acid:sodium symporter family protein [Sphingomonas sp.]
MARVPRSFPFVDPFLLWLIGAVAAASLLPARGAAAVGVDALADIAIALLFFLHGARLSRAAIVQGIGNFRLHALTLGSTYVLFPAIGLALVAVLARAVPGWIDPLLLSGLLYLTLLPSTVQSSIAFTAMARGNVAAAVCSASLSNVVGIVLTPLLVALFLNIGGGGGGGGGGASTGRAVGAIGLQLLLPFLAGHALRPVIGGVIDRNKRILMPVDRGSILLVVYSAFSAAVVGGIWSRVGAADLVVLLVLCVIVLGVVMAVNVAVARLAGLPRADAIALLFCGSKKSLVSGVPMAGALFPSAQVGLILLPLMIFHQLQLFVCAALAARFARSHEASADPAVPRTPDAIAAAADARGLSIPAACMPGVVANLAILDHHAATLRAPPPPPPPPPLGAAA